MSVFYYGTFYLFLIFFPQMYTVSQEGTLCIWESDTDLEGLRKGLKCSERKEKEEKKLRDSEMEGNEANYIEIMGEDGETRGDVIKGSAETPEEVEGIKNVSYLQKSK